MGRLELRSNIGLNARHASDALRVETEGGGRFDESLIEIFSDVLWPLL